MASEVKAITEEEPTKSHESSLTIAGPQDLQPRRVWPPIASVKNGDLTKRHMLSFISAAVAQNGLMGHNIDGFNDLVENGIGRIMTEMFNTSRRTKYDRTNTESDRKRKSLEIAFQFHDVSVGRPSYTTYIAGETADLMPNLARLTGRPYSGAVTLGATATVRVFNENGTSEEKTAEIPPFQIGAFPIMVRSNRCHTNNLTREGLKSIGEDPTDFGGYFIAKRGEYVIDLLENIRYNSVHLHRQMRDQELVRAEFLSQPGGAFENSSQFILRYMANGQITIELNSPKFKKVKLPFYVIYRLFGMTDDRAITSTIVFDAEDSSPNTAKQLEILERAFHLAEPLFQPLISELNREKLVHMTAERMAKFLTNPNAYVDTDHAIQFLNEDLLGGSGRAGGLDKALLPHMGQTSESRIRKVRFIGLLIHKMLLVHLGVLPPTDRDSYRNKRVHGAGVSLAKAFKTQVNNSIVSALYSAFRRELKNNPWESITERTLSDTFRNALTSTDLNRAMEQAITSGNKAIIVRRRAVTNRVSSQQLERKNGLNTISAGRSVVTQNSGNAAKSTDRADKMRRAHPTYTGFICLSQSADTGESVGLKKQLALGASVCTAGEALPLKLRLRQDPAVTEADRVRGADMLRGAARIYVNGEWIGCCGDAPALVGRYRALRREGRIVDPRTTIAWDPITDEVEFWLDVGRLVRPLFIVDNNIAEYDAAMTARHRWFVAHGVGPVRADAAGVRYEAWGEHYIFTPSWPQLSPADAEAALRSPPDALVSRGLAVPGERAPAAAAPPRVEFVQNIRFTVEQAEAIVQGRLKLNALIEEGAVEYITPEEQENCLLAQSIDVLRANRNNVTRRYTHCDIEQALMGLAAHMSPYGNHTQPARVTYETNQSRQTGGWYAFNFPYRTDKIRFFQFYNEIPIVRTITHKLVPANGMNTIIAYASYGGDNQEDSAIICRASADRGLFAGAYFRFELGELEKGEAFCNPDALTTKNLKPNASYEKLVDGFIRVGSIVTYGDVMIGRVAKLNRGRTGVTDHYQFTDRSIVYRRHEPAIVEDVLRLRGNNDELFGVIKLRYERPLRTGDKLSSRSGNKSIAALMLPQSDMPFTEDGMTPDIIINTNSFPTRMTIGQLIETAVGTVCAHRGIIADGTAFLNVDHEAIRDEMIKCGFRSNGRHRMYNGFTGEYFDAAIFIGPTAEQRLQKFVLDDEQSVAGSGPTDATTGQPLGGKNVQGGLRLGEMENWALESHGSMLNLYEKTSQDSDGREMYVCRGCGSLAVYNEYRNIYVCRTCKDLADISVVDGSKSAILLHEELAGANIKFRLGLRPREFEAGLVRDDV